MKLSQHTFHLAGIVPVAGQPLDFNFPWHDCLQPIAPNYLAIEHAVVECAMAGCRTIWIVCNDDVTPLVRHRIGDYIQDPIWLGRKFDRFPSASRKPISIFYVRKIFSQSDVAANSKPDHPNGSTMKTAHRNLRYG